MNIVDMAALYARAAHAAIGQKRKYTGEPYHWHTASVADTVSQFGGSDEMIAAAHLHDVVEDTEVGIAEVFDVFGQAIASLVWQLTDRYSDPSLGNRGFRKTIERDRLSEIDADAQTIKYADLIDNTGSIVRHDPGFAKVYLPEKRALLAVMTRGNSDLRSEAWATLEAAEAHLAERSQ